MNVGSSDAVARIAAIQGMAASLGMGAQPSSGGFSSALQAAESAGGAGGPQTAAATPVAFTGGAVGGMKYAAEINAAAKKHGIDPALLAGLVKQESGFNPNARSAAGASGLTQLMPATARSLGVTDPTDPAQALDGGAKYLRQMLDRFGGDERLALAAYNAGPGAVSRFGGVPPYAETKAYVEKVLANKQTLLASATASATPIGTAATALPAASATAGGTSPVSIALDSPSSSASSGSRYTPDYPTT